MTFTLPTYFFIILIGILTTFLTFLTTKGDLINSGSTKNKNGLTMRGIKVLFILIAMIITLFWQEYNNQAIGRNKDSILQKERDSRDKLITNGITKGVDSITSQLFENLSIAFVKQNIKIESLNLQIGKLSDSKQLSLNSYSSNEPLLFIDSLGIYLKQNKDFNSSYGISFKSAGAGSSSFDIQTYLLTFYSDGIFDLGKVDFFQKNLKIAKDYQWSTGFNIYSKVKVKKIYINLKGEYKSFDTTKSYAIDNLYVYDAVRNRCSIVIGTEYDRIINIIKYYPAKKIYSRES